VTTYAAVSPTSSGTRIGSRRWAWARLVGAALILVILVWRLGVGPFVDGLRLVDAPSLAAAFVIGAVTTVCCAWRWSLVAGGLGVSMPLRRAVPAYYQSLFINLTLPGGVLGDVHRAVHHGRETGDVSRGARAVVWERSAGQVIQIAITVAALLLLPSPLHESMPVVAALTVLGAIGIVLLARSLPRDGQSRFARTARAVSTDVNQGLLARRAWPGIVIASIVVVLGHATTLLIAARTSGLNVSPARMLPLALLILLVMSVPLSIGGWGLREGAAAWAFAMAGLGAAQGVTTAVIYGVLVLVAALPGALVLLVTSLRRTATTEGVVRD
jgi:uncharacterized membrane protein YbhN (UPF0104 family)